MKPIALLVKSYSGDLPYAQRLVESFHLNNVDSLHLYMVVPEADTRLFEDMTCPTITVMAEEILSRHLVTAPINDLRTGYANQEIVKLSFWELELAQNYFCVDSDAIFISDFRASDFIDDNQIPYTVLVEDRDLKADPDYFRDYWQDREHLLRRIQSEVGLTDPLIRTCHGHQVLSSTVLASFRDDFLLPRSWGYRDAIAIAPYEFSWYNFWLQATEIIPIHAREPYAKVFHHAGHHFEFLFRGQSIEDLARSYMLLVINSNFSRGMGVISPTTDKPQALVPYLSYGELARLFRAKLKDSWQRRTT